MKLASLEREVLIVWQVGPRSHDPTTTVVLFPREFNEVPERADLRSIKSLNQAIQLKQIGQGAKRERNIFYSNRIVGRGALLDRE